MIVVLESATEREHLLWALRRHVQVLGVDKVPEAFIDAIADIGRHSSPLAASLLDLATPDVHARLMTFQEVAGRLNLSKRHLSRLVADGALVKVGRRITTESVIHLEAGGS